MISASRGEAGAGFKTDQSVDVQTIRVLIADDQALFRRGLFVVLGVEDHIEVVA